MVKKYPDGIQQLNIIEEAKKDHDEVSDVYGELVDLGTDYSYNSIAIYSTLNQDVNIKIGSSVITILSNTSRALDSFDHNGVIYWKWATAQPTSGTLQLLSY